MKKIVIIGANYFQNPLILKAKEMGFETHVFAWQDGSIGEKTADFFYPVSIVEKEEILEKCKEIKPDAVATIASDLANITVQYLAENLGLPCNTKESIQISTNKFEMRDAFKKNSIPTPGYVRVGVEDDFQEITKGLRYPLIVKPTDRSGSRGITKINNAEEIVAAVGRAVKDSFEKKAIIEEYIEGDEYSCESISYEGIHHILAVTKKYTTGAPNYIETGHIEPAPLPEEIYNKLYELIPNALNALQIRMGASHAEFKVTADGEIRIIEIGSRMGGDCIGSDLVSLSTGYDFLKMVIETAEGKAPSIVRNHEEKCAAIKFILKKEDLKQLEQLREEQPEMVYYVSEIDEIDSRQVIDSSTRYGFYIIKSDDEDSIRTLFKNDEER